MVAEEQEAGRDHQLGEWRMRVKERLGANVVAGLGHEVNFIEDDLGREAEMPKPGRRRGGDQRRQHDGVDTEPRNSAERLACARDRSGGPRTYVCGAAVK